MEIRHGGASTADEAITVSEDSPHEKGRQGNDQGRVDDFRATEACL